MRASFTLATATRERELVVTTLERSTYHHGDLRTVLLSTGLAMLEAGEPFSLRALARQARGHIALGRQRGTQFVDEHHRQSRAGGQQTEFPIAIHDDVVESDRGRRWDLFH